MITNHLIATFLLALTGFFLYLLAHFTNTMVTLLSIIAALTIAVSAYRCLYEMVKLSRS